MISAKEKAKVISGFKRHDTDTGSAEVQVAILTEEIERLADHLKKHRKDNHSRRGLLSMVARRRSLLGYLERESPDMHRTVAKKLGLKK